MTEAAAPLTVGTAGHIDHGKTALVQALTGVDTDRLPEEKRRGITIVLGYAALRLPSGRLLSLVDVPGHERLIRVMASGATGIDLFLLAVAADDGVMPQTVEHVRVLRALDVTRGVVAITKSDLADPGPVATAAAMLVPGVEIVTCSVRDGIGVADVAAALERVVAGVAPRRSPERAPILHVDRVFTITGAGTVVTGTLWSGQIRRGDHLRLLPGDRPARVRGVQVHDRAAASAPAGQRVAVNLAGVERRSVAPGDVLAGPEAPVSVTYRVEARLELHEPLAERERIQVHHGTRSSAARAIRHGDDVWQLRVERPLIAGDGDRLVVRRISPPDTLGGGVILTAAAGGRRLPAPPGRSPNTPAAPAAPAPVAPEPLPDRALALEARLRAAGHEPLDLDELGADADQIPALLAQGRAVRVGRSMYAHPDEIARVRAAVQRVIAAEGAVTLSRLRDELSTSRKYAQALLEHLDAARITRRLPDDSRILRRSAAASSALGAGDDGGGQGG